MTSQTQTSISFLAHRTCRGQTPKSLYFLLRLCRAKDPRSSLILYSRKFGLRPSLRRSLVSSRGPANKSPCLWSTLETFFLPPNSKCRLYNSFYQDTHDSPPKGRSLRHWYYSIDLNRRARFPGRQWSLLTKDFRLNSRLPFTSPYASECRGKLGLRPRTCDYSRWCHGPRRESPSQGSRLQ